MKIGIVTMPLCANYGGILQNWALQQILIKMGHEPITLRLPVMYQGMSSTHYWLKVFPKQLARFIVHKFLGKRCKMPMTIRRWNLSVCGMEKFIKDHVYVTEFLPNLSLDDVRRYGIEVLVVGSDQIWRPVKYDAVKYYFLGFAKDSNISRIAYAPSIALEEWPFNSIITSQLKELIKQFTAVSVREISSVKLVKDNLGVEAQWVLDPTMLLMREDYINVCKSVPVSNEKFIFAYILDMTETKRLFIEDFAKNLDCNVLYLTAGNVNSKDTIEHWLASFRDSAFIITDSYHGTVFSLIFQKQFYTFYNEKRGNARMDTLKEIFGLGNRFIKEPVLEALTDLNDFIDYANIIKVINNMRDKSLLFLQKSLLKTENRIGDNL